MQRNEGWIGGVVLVVLGVGLLIGQLEGDVGRFVLLAIGIALLVLYVVTRSPGALIGGGIVTGLGAGVLAATYLEGDQAGAAVLFGLGGGFLFVWLIGLLLDLDETRIWPLIPGTIMIVIGAAVLAQADPKLVGFVWPAALIALGVVVIGAAFLRRPSDRSVPPTTPPGAVGPDPTRGS